MNNLRLIKSQAELQTEFLKNAAGHIGYGIRPSERTMIKNGVKPASDYVEADGNVIKRYWIKMTS